MRDLLMPWSSLTVVELIVLLFYRGGSRQVSVKDFFINERNCIHPDEVLVGIEVPFTDQV